MAIPELITPDLAAHVMTYARPGDDGIVFTSPGGGPLRHTNFRRRSCGPAEIIASERMVKEQQMRCTPRGARLLLQVRTHVLNDQFAGDFRR